MGVVVPSRLLAVSVYRDVRENCRYFAEALDEQLTKHLYSTADRGYGTRLARITVGSSTCVRPYVESLLNNPKGLPPHILDCLIVSATEILYLESPDHVIDQGVELVKKYAPGLSGVANAVLRKVATTRDLYFTGSNYETINTARRFGFAPWLADLLIQQKGGEIACQIMEVSNTEPPIFVRELAVSDGMWREKLISSGGKATETGLAHGQRIEGFSSLRSHADVVQRSLMPVDLAAQFIAGQVECLKPARVLDVCCGRGTKSLIIADNARRAGRTLSVTAIDNDSRKIRTATEDATRLGYSEITYLGMDGTSFSSTDELFDVVMVDAPCSGLGTLRRHCDKRMTLQEDDLSDLSSLNSKILQNAADCVRPGGTVIYSTCTIQSSENEDVVNTFLASVNGKDYCKVKVAVDKSVSAMISYVEVDGFCQILPTIGGSDGHFVALLQRRT